MATPRIVVVGSLNVDLVSRIDRLPLPGETVTALEFETHAGGKGGNQAYAAARLGGRVTMIGCVGADAHGESLREGLAGVGVDVSTLDEDPDLPSGMALVTVDAAGQNQIVVIPGANGALTPARLERSRSTLAAASVVLLQLEIPLETVAAAARIAHAAGALVILDPAPAQSLPDDLLPHVHYVTPNVTELLALTADRPTADAMPDPGAIRARASRLLERGAGGVIVKQGEAGARLVTGGRDLHWPALPTAVVDTTGAGDTFNAALAVALTEGMSIEAAGELACAAASLSVARRGARAGMPTRAETMALLRAAR